MFTKILVFIQDFHKREFMGYIIYFIFMFYNFHQDKVVVVSRKFKSVAIYEWKEQVIKSYADSNVPTLVNNLKTSYQATDVDKVLTEVIG